VSCLLIYACLFCHCRRELRARYRDKAWIDAFSKSDMLVEELQRASSYRLQLEEQQQQQRQQHREEHQLPDHSSLSPSSADGLQQVSTSGVQMFGRDCLEDVEEVFGDASEVVARLPHALAVSSLTELGIAELQAVIIAMFSELAAKEASTVISATAVSSSTVIE